MAGGYFLARAIKNRLARGGFSLARVLQHLTPCHRECLCENAEGPLTRLRSPVRVDS